MSQKAEARGTRIKDRLQFGSKPKLLTFGPDTTVKDAAMAMAENRYGSVVAVDEDEKVLGIVTERDVLNNVVAKRFNASGQPDLVVQARAMLKATAGRNFQYSLLFGGFGLYVALMLLVFNSL